MTTDLDRIVRRLRQLALPDPHDEREVMHADLFTAAADMLLLLDAKVDVLDNAIDDVIGERQRQIEREGFNTAHDDDHTDGSLAAAAGCYAFSASRHWEPESIRKAFWPWAEEYWKPKGKRRDLVRAAALIIAEIERLDRLNA